MVQRRVIVELKYNKDLAEVAFNLAPEPEKSLDLGTVPKLAGINFDASYSPTLMPGLVEQSPLHAPYIAGVMFELAVEPKASTYIVRAEVDDDRINDLAGHRSVVGVYADVQIEPTIVCPESPPMGTDADVERLLCVPDMHRRGMDGSGVLIAIVDSGINLGHLASRGKTLTLDSARSWVPNEGMTPGDAPPSHGTMCAFDAAIAAPRATFLDIQLLLSTATGPTIMSALLSDAVKAYSHLFGVMNAPRRPGESRSMVVNNSWGMFGPSWDFPVGHPANYSNNPNHPFNLIVAALEREGADILFAAGNCGSDCPDRRCSGLTADSIYGANGHPSVLTVAGVDQSRKRVGYSTQGPGRLARFKPDVCGYTHFRGSGIYPADGGTSAATPVVAGVVAAVRTRKPYADDNPAVSPAAVRSLIRLTADEQDAGGFDFDYGFGVVSGRRLVAALEPFDSELSEPPLPTGLANPSDPGAYVQPGSAAAQPSTPAAPTMVNSDASSVVQLFEAAWRAGYNAARHAPDGAGTNPARQFGATS